MIHQEIKIGKKKIFSLETFCVEKFPIDNIVIES